MPISARQRKGNVLAILAAGALFGCTRGPKLELTETVHDFGKVISGETLEHRFAFRNTGDEPLVVQSLHSSCGCTIADIWAEGPEGRNRQGDPGKIGEVLTLAPNESGRLLLTIQTKMLAHTEEQKSGVVTLITNEKRPAPATVQFQVFLEKPYHLEKTRFDFGAMGRKEIKLVESKLTIRDRPRFKITQIIPNVPGLNAQWILDEGSPELSHIQIQAGPGLPPGPLNGQIEFVTNLGKEHRFAISIYANVLADITIEPPAFHFPAVSKGKAAEAKLDLRCTDPDFVLELKNLTLEGPDAGKFTIEPKNLEPGRRWELWLKSDASLETPAFRGNVRIETNHPEHGVLSIPYRGFVR